MAFGTGNRSFGPNAVLYSFQIKSKDLPAPIFKVEKKGSDGQYHPILVKDEKTGESTPMTATRVSGNIISASPKENTHEGKLIRSINLSIQDGDDVYFTSVGETFLGRNLYNALLGLKTFDEIEISLYQSRPKPPKPGQPASNKTFASVSLRQHGEPVRGPYDQKTDMPQPKKVRVSGKDQTDTEELDNWFREKMIAWCKVVNAAAPKQTSSSAAPASGAASAPSAEDEGVHAGAPTGGEAGDEDVPF